jgi:hypothetical protein
MFLAASTLSGKFGSFCWRVFFYMKIQALFDVKITRRASPDNELLPKTIPRMSSSYPVTGTCSAEGAFTTK